ncbi:MAG: cytochrome b/b6 domain-containing protein [Granulicella sp.]
MATQSQPVSQIREKHPLAIRWMHWVNFPLLFTMIWSGILIYWADSIPDVGHPSKVYRVGIGSHTLFRFFPDWFYAALHVQYKLTTGLGYHFFFMWLFAINGIAYIAYLIFSGAWRDIVPSRHALRDAWHVFLHDLHLRKEAPHHRKYNSAQRIAYTLVILMGAASCLTGLAIWKPTSLHWITTLCGGYETARWLHFWLTIGFVAFFLIHVWQVVLAGWNNFRSMVSGDELVTRDTSEPVQTEQPLA